MLGPGAQLAVVPVAGEVVALAELAAAANQRLVLVISYSPIHIVSLRITNHCSPDDLLGVVPGQTLALAADAVAAVVAEDLRRVVRLTPGLPLALGYYLSLPAGEYYLSGEG